MSDDKLQTHEAGYDRVSEALAHASALFWKEMLGKLAEGKTDKLAGPVTAAEVADFFALLGGANMSIDLTPNVAKGTKCIFDGGGFTPDPWKKSKDAKKVEGSISIGINIRW